MRMLVLAACFTSTFILSGCAGDTQNGASGPVQEQALGEGVVAFVGGQWFTGTAEETTGYAVDGMLTF